MSIRPKRPSTSCASNGDVGHDADVAVADNLHKLHDAIALSAEGFYAGAIDFGLANGANGRLVATRLPRTRCILAIAPEAALNDLLVRVRLKRKVE